MDSCPTCHRPLIAPDASLEGKAHADAGDTERAAARSSVLRNGTQRSRVLRAIADHDVTGATDDDISVATGIDRMTVAPRRHELVQSGHIVDSGYRRLTRNRCQAIVWETTQAGDEWCMANPEEAR